MSERNVSFFVKCRELDTYELAPIEWCW